MNLYPEFFNDVFGPIMQPGSSSHMAGPCRLTFLCRSLLGEDVAKIRIDLDKNGSLAGTMGTMNEDIGLYDGAVGHNVDNPDFFKIFEYLKAKKIEHEICFGTLTESRHDNAVKCTLTGVSGKVASLVGNSVGGGMVETVTVNGYSFSGRGDTWVICVFDNAGEWDAERLDAMVAGHQSVLENGTSERSGGGRLFWYKTSESITDALKEALGNTPWGVLCPLLPVPTTRQKKPQLFRDMVEWRRLTQERSESMSEIAIQYEMDASGWPREKVVSYMRDVVQKNMHRRVYAVANREVEPEIGPFFAPTCKNWGEQMGSVPLLKGLPAKALYYAFSARVPVPGILNVPGPQGNGGGFLAGVLYAVMEECGLTDEDMLRGLFVAAGVGAICYSRTEPTGEVIGCAGEVGVNSAMTAAAIVEMLRGTPQQIENAASFALQAAVGWPCDIIPGGFGMPCEARIMHMAVMSIAYAQFALCNENPILPFHEVVDIADKVGRQYPSGTHCTGHGGLCMAPTAQTCARRLQDWRESRGKN